jgi:hypothetical protein
MKLAPSAVRCHSERSEEHMHRTLALPHAMPAALRRWRVRRGKCVFLAALRLLRNLPVGVIPSSARNL